MALGLFGSRARPGLRGGIYGMNGLGAGPAAASFTTTSHGATYNTGGVNLVSTGTPTTIQTQPGAANSSVKPVLIAGAVAVGGYFLWKHFKKAR